jgi:hypothetical protein
MVKTPFRSMGRMCYADHKFKDVLDRYVLGIGLCELACSRGVPVVQHFIRWLVSSYCFDKTKPMGSVDKMPALLSLNKAEYAEPTSEARYDFEKAFDITVE